MTAIVLVSGGMDSCVSAAIASAENDEIVFLHISYGQRTETRERKAFNDIAERFVFRPLVRRAGTVSANLAAFGFSGLLHDLVISVPAWGGSPVSIS